MTWEAEPALDRLHVLTGWDFLYQAI